MYRTLLYMQLPCVNGPKCIAARLHGVFPTGRIPMLHQSLVACVHAYWHQHSQVGIGQHRPARAAADTFSVTGVDAVLQLFAGT
jgi:hypothetical protein